MLRIDKKENNRSPVDCTTTQNINLLHFNGEDTVPSLGYHLHRQLVL